jgi:hypothetical protein
MMEAVGDLGDEGPGQLLEALEGPEGVRGVAAHVWRWSIILLLIATVLGAYGVGCEVLGRTNSSLDVRTLEAGGAPAGWSFGWTRNRGSKYFVVTGHLLDGDAVVGASGRRVYVPVASEVGRSEAAVLYYEGSPTNYARASATGRLAGGLHFGLSDRARTAFAERGYRVPAQCWTLTDIGDDLFGSAVAQSLLTTALIVAGAGLLGLLGFTLSRRG